jgi:hypothetical protein
MPICIFIKERYIGFEVPDVPIKDRILPAIPGIIVVVLILEALYHLHLSHGITLGMTVAIIFVILVYPMILKRWQKRTEQGTAAEPVD